MAGNSIEMSGKRCPEEFDRIDKVKSSDKFLVNDSEDGINKYCTPSQINKGLLELELHYEDAVQAKNDAQAAATEAGNSAATAGMRTMLPPLQQRQNHRRMPQRPPKLTRKPLRPTPKPLKLMRSHQKVPPRPRRQRLWLQRPMRRSRRQQQKPLRLQPRIRRQRRKKL